MRENVSCPRNASGNQSLSVHSARWRVNPVKIAFISTYNIPCGISTYTENLTNALSAHPCTIVVLANKVLPSYFDTGHGRCEYIRCWDRLTGHFDGIKNEIEKHHPHIVHFQFEYGLFAADPKAVIELLDWLRRRRIAIVMTPHSVVKRSKYFAGWDFMLKRNFPWFREVLNRIDAAIVHTGIMQKTLRAWDFPESRIDIIPHGVETSERISQSEARRKLNLPLDKKIVLSFGLITYSKNIHSNIRIISNLSTRFPNLYYLIAGFPQSGSNDANALYAKALFKQLGRQGNIHFDIRFVPHDRIKYYLCSADIYLLNYTRTPASASGNACLALAYGIPSITSRAYLLDDMTEDVCLKVDVNAPKQVTHALTRLLTEPNLCNTLKEKSLAMAQTRSWEKTAVLHLHLYEKVCGGLGEMSCQ